MRILLNVRQQLLIPLLKKSWQEVIVIRIVEVFNHALSLISDLNQTISVLIKLLLRRSWCWLRIHRLRDGSLFKSTSVQSSVDLFIFWSHQSLCTSILHRSIMIRGLALGELLRLGFLDCSMRRISLALTISSWVNKSHTRLRSLFVRLRPHLILTLSTLVVREPSALREIINRILKLSILSFKYLRSEVLVTPIVVAVSQNNLLISLRRRCSLDVLQILLCLSLVVHQFI